MKQALKKLNSIRSASNENGFTVLELIIVVLIISILAAIAVPIYSGQQRAAIEATVKQDVESNRHIIVGDTKGLYIASDKFTQLSVSTGDNKRGYEVNPNQTIACEWASHEFASNDIVTWHFLTTDGVIKEGTCPGLGDDDTPGGNPPWEGGQDDGNENPPPSKELTQMAGVIFTKTYSPQTNSLNFCYTINMKIDPNYQFATQPPSAVWQYKIDLNQPPFWGLNPNTDLNSAYGYKTVSLADNIWTIAGEGWNNTVDNNNPRTVGFCTTRVPEPPLNPDTYSYTVRASPNNSNWWACVDFTVTSTLEYPTPWEITVNLDKYFQHITGKDPQFINLTGTKVSENTYKVTGIGWNRYVASSMPRTYSTSICYTPNGEQW